MLHSHPGLFSQGNIYNIGKQTVPSLVRIFRRKFHHYLLKRRNGTTHRKWSKLTSSLQLSRFCGHYTSIISTSITLTSNMNLDLNENNVLMHFVRALRHFSGRRCALNNAYSAYSTNNQDPEHYSQNIILSTQTLIVWCYN